MLHWLEFVVPSMYFEIYDESWSICLLYNNSARIIPLMRLPLLLTMTYLGAGTRRKKMK